MTPSLALKVSYIIGVSIAYLLLPTSGAAQTIDVSGRYQCAQAKVRGKVVPCTAAPLTLKNAVGRVVRLFCAFASQNRAWTQDCVSLPREAWLVRNDL